MEKRKGLYATLSPFKKKEVRFLQPYFYQGGKWFKLGGKKNVSQSADIAVQKKAAK